MSKSEILTEADLENFRIHPATKSRIEEACGSGAGRKAEFRILDWGCGRGRAVAWLRMNGYQAYGVDIDRGPLENGRPFFQNRGWDAHQILMELRENGTVDYPDGSFDLCFSDQVLEHVRNLAPLAEELRRLLKPGGVAIHIFPARWRIREPHLGMPFIHWLPKHRPWRRWAIFACLLLGINPKWRQAAGMSRWDSSGIYADYTLLKTYYRSLSELRKPFLDSRFEVRFLRGNGLGDDSRSARSLVSAWLHRHFGSVRLLVIKEARKAGRDVVPRTGIESPCAV